MQAIISYAQENEDIILYHALKEVEKVFWIDVGANDPDFISVTKFFSEMGGYGINIEPQICYREKYELERPNDINLFVGVGDQAGKMLLMGEDTGASFVAEDGKSEGVEIEICTLEAICDKYISEEQVDNIHFLKIDVEGFEKQVIQGMNFKKYRPWIIVIESVEPNSTIPSHEKWESLILEEEYVFAAMYGPNRYYVEKNKEDLIGKINEWQDVEQQYNVFHMMDYDLCRMNYEKYVKAVHNSMSWKITAPLRAVYGFLKGEKHGS